MTHVRIQTTPEGFHSLTKVEVGGHDITSMVTDIRINIEGRTDRPQVLLEALPEILNIDLDDADVTTIVPEGCVEPVAEPEPEPEFETPKHGSLVRERFGG